MLMLSYAAFKQNKVWSLVSFTSLLSGEFNMNILFVPKKIEIAHKGDNVIPNTEKQHFHSSKIENIGYFCID